MDFDGGTTATVVEFSAASKKRYYIDDVKIYQEAATPVCNAVTVPADGGVTPRQNDVTIVWNAPDPAPANGYKVTVKGEGYEKSVTVTDATQIVWASELTPETRYEYSIVSLCGEDFESDPVGATFTTLSADQPSLTITEPDNDAVFSGDVEFAFTTTNFELGDSKLVKVEVKTDIENPSTAPAIKTLYTKASPVVISGLEDGQYHIDLYLANVTAKTEGEGNDTVVVNLGHYVHRNIEVKHPSIYFEQKTLALTGTYQGMSVEGKMKVIGWALPEATDKVTIACPEGNFSVTPAELTRDAVMADGGAEITVSYNGAKTSETVDITLTYGAMTDKFTVTATTTEVRELETLAGLYSSETNVHYRVKGKMVVTHKDSYNNRIWVQDIDKDNGASMLLLNATAGYDAINVEDVLENVLGKLDITSQNLRRFTPVGTLAAVEHNHAIYVDTLTVADCHARIATVQNALVCVENVAFTQSGEFTANKTYTYPMAQGRDTLDFYTTFTGADYMGQSIPAEILNVTGILGIYKDKAQITARNKADMAGAPCVEPVPLEATAQSYSATIRWTSKAAADSVRYSLNVDMSEAVKAKVSGVEKAYRIENLLTPATKYYFQVKSLCSATQESEWSDVKEFTTKAATDPTIAIELPTSMQEFTDSVTVRVYVRNVRNLGVSDNDTAIRITFSNGVVVKTADTLTKHALPTGEYTVEAELVKGETALPGVDKAERRFSVNLPDVEAPVFAPGAGRYTDSVEVTLACGTDGASIFYAKGDEAFVAYTEGAKIVLKETATLKAFATKERMDTSATVTATYTIAEGIAIEGDLVLFEDFSKSETASTTAITDFDKIADVSGWSGANMYPEVNEIKGGTSSKGGKLVSPALNLSHDNGKYYVVFTARAFDNAKDATTIRLIAGEDTVSVEGLDKTKMSEYVYMFTNGMADMKITFEAVNAANNRFYLDSIRVYQVLPQVPTIMAPANMTVATFQGVSVSKEVTVKGKLLDADVTVACNAPNFTVAPATLAKADVMGEGAVVTVTFNGNKTLDTAEITFTSGDLTETMKVYASAEEVVTVASLSELCKGTQGKIYKVSGKVVVTAMDNNYRNYKWIQDEHAGIMIDDATALVQNTYAVGDGIEGVYGRLGNYKGQLQLAMVGNLPEASSHGNAITPIEVSAADLKAGIDTLCSRVVKLTGLELESAEGVWAVATTYKALQGDADVNVRTILENADFLGEALPQGVFDLVGLAAVENNTVRVAPRSKADIIEQEGSECAAPTGLKVTIDNEAETATASWKGAASEYKVVLLAANNSKDTVEQLSVKTKSYTFKAVKPNVEYAWAVASVCEDGDHWTKGQDFTIKKVANEGMEQVVAGIYPNPTSGLVYVELTESARMEIFTAGGLVVRTAELTAGKNELMLNQSGIYFIRLSNAKGSIVKRVVVR
ncbi:MAG: DUF5689 domain-containing protein [Bacteroides sp.]|nr:DUF5689 domain-containing protein [Bacteroides sp.]